MIKSNKHISLLKNDKLQPVNKKHCEKIPETFCFGDFLKCLIRLQSSSLYSFFDLAKW